MNLNCEAFLERQRAAHEAFPLISIQKIARTYDISVRQLRRWEKAGLMPPRTKHGHRWKYQKIAVAELMASHGKERRSEALRLEVRCKPKCSGNELIGLKNPFNNVLLLPADVLNELKLGFPGRILADSIRVRGLKHALAPFPPDQRKLITALLKAKQSLLPDADQLWTSWKTALIQSGLGKELGLLKPPPHPAFLPEGSGLQLIPKLPSNSMELS
jgi:transposase-like protein